jgi:hypothetical protein
MRVRNRRGSLAVAFVSLMLGATVLTVHAEPITIPGYTVTDLGPGTPTFSTDAKGHGVLNALKCQISAFSQTNDTTLNTGPGTTTPVPLLVPAPINDPFTYGIPAYAFASVESALVNSNGVVAVTEESDLLICGILMWSLIRFDLRSFDWLL